MLSRLHARKVIVLADRACDVTSCAQSCREMYAAWKHHIPTFLWPHTETNLHRLERSVRQLQVDISEGQGQERTSTETMLGMLDDGQLREEMASCLGRDDEPTERVRELLQTGLYQYTAAVERATGFRVFNRDLVWRLLPEFEYLRVGKNVRKKHDVFVESLRNDYQRKESETEEIRRKLTMERSTMAKEKEANQRMNDGRVQVEQMSLDQCSGVMTRTRELEQRLLKAKMDVAAKKTRVAGLEQDLGPMEEELKKQQQRAQAGKERYARVQDSKRTRY